MSELTKEAMENKEPKSSESSEKSCEKEKKASKKELSKLTKELEAAKKELESVQSALEKEKEENGAQNDRYLRMMAEYDNFRKRATAEKDAAYTAALADVIAEILPVIDTLELALRYGTEGEQMTKGVQMTLAKFTETLEKLGVCEIETETFDPNFHNAVMHVEDDAFGEGQIVEVFQKGYKKGEKIIRYAMVKVAN